MITKSIRIDEAEAAEISSYLQLVGGTEASLLKEAVERGFRDVRLSRGVLAYLDGAPTAEAARIAGLPRALFLHSLAERGIALLRGESSVGAELGALFHAEAATDTASEADAALSGQPAPARA